MPRYSVRMYSSYVDEFEVEAATEAEAVDLADGYLYAMDGAGGLEKFADKVELIAKHEYVDHDQTYVNELDEDGNWLDA